MILIFWIVLSDLIIMNYASLKTKKIENYDIFERYKKIKN